VSIKSQFQWKKPKLQPFLAGQTASESAKMSSHQIKLMGTLGVKEIMKRTYERPVLVKAGFLARSTATEPVKEDPHVIYPFSYAPV
jgi:hypothetical protein